ncbi:MAG: hypothetical protein ABR606_02695 [Vicinamibacterales bacterium]
MTIQNRQRHVRRADGSVLTVSEYCYQPDVEKQDSNNDVGIEVTASIASHN